MNEEQKEKKYLKDLLKKVDQRLIEIDDAIDLKKEEIDYMNNHMQEHKRDMDHLEKNAMRIVAGSVFILTGLYYINIYFHLIG